MPVTEFALMHLVGEGVTDDFRELADYCQTVQDTWVLRQNPDLPAGRIERGTGMCQQIEDPSVILVSAQWNSPLAHWEWIAADEAKSVMARLGPHVISEGEKRVVLFHIDSAIFTPGGPDPDTPSLLTSPVISVGRMLVDSDKKAEFEAKFNEVKGILEDFAKPKAVKGGWRIEKENEATNEFVLYCGWESVENHMEFAKTEGFSKYREVMDHIRSNDIKHYRRFV